MILRRERPSQIAPVSLCVAVLIAALLASCSTAVPVCAPVLSEDLDPLSDQHVLPTTEVTYLSNPPTSGPHLSLSPPTGVLTEAISPALQVTALEAGSVIIHHSPGQNIEPLLDLAADDVIIVPGQDLDTAIVFTAWQTRQNCTAPDAAAARSFIRDHAGQTIGH